MLQIHVTTSYSTTHKGFRKKPKLVAELGEAPGPARPAPAPLGPFPFLPVPPARPAGGGEGISPAKVTGPSRPRRPPPSATRSPPSRVPPRRGAVSGRAPPPFVKRSRRPPRGIPAASPACGRASCSGCCPRGGRCRWGRSSRRARGSRAGGGGRREGAGRGRGRSGNSLSPRGGGRRGLQLGARSSALGLPTRLKVRRGGGGGRSDGSGGRRPAGHGREFARGAGAPGTLRAAAEEQRRRVPTSRGLNHRPESAPAGGGEAAAHRPAPRPGPPAPPRSPAGRRARSPAGPPAPARSFPGWGLGAGEPPAPPLWCNGWVWLPACRTFLGGATPAFLSPPFSSPEHPRQLRTPARSPF